MSEPITAVTAETEEQKRDANAERRRLFNERHGLDAWSRDSYTLQANNVRLLAAMEKRILGAKK